MNHLYWQKAELGWHGDNKQIWIATKMETSPMQSLAKAKFWPITFHVMNFSQQIQTT